MDEKSEGLTDLDRLIEQCETEQASESEPKQQAQNKEQAAQDSEAAGNLGVWAVKALELGFKAVDSRVSYAPETYQEGREALGPIAARFNLGVSTDRVPYGEEMRAGWFLGKVIKASWLSLCDLWAADKEKAKQNGDKRENGTEERTRAMAGAERPRQEHSYAQSGYSAEPGGESYFMGPEQGSQSA